ncbi:MAG: biotin--[acetyl-CoA-carboxylase] ligase [Candidatus Omnitrophica bacterium]|nr:biotin--[acetyl-CoA-carboxylase] ligase [Candidatus Omnitrophota bacterium]
MAADFTQILADILKRRSEQFISGEELSHHLGITRTAVWKHIESLRDLGYHVLAVPHLGYRLTSLPDRLFPWEIQYNLKTKFIGKTIHYYNNLSSTMDKAMECALSGASEGTLVITERQTKGRGRMGRDWFSPKYKGLYLSLILKPKIPPQQSLIFTIIAALACCLAIKKTTGLDARVKWPNDILLDNKKLAGILVELSAEMDIVHTIIVGIGINVNPVRSKAPGATAPPNSVAGTSNGVNSDIKFMPSGAISLNEVNPALSTYEATLRGRKGGVNRLFLLKTLLEELEKQYLNFRKFGAKDIIKAWRKHSDTLGKHVKIFLGNKAHIEGLAQDIDEDGSLLVRQANGLVKRVFSCDALRCLPIK